MATYYLDLEGGSDAADGLSFANRWKTFTSGATAARIAPGDTIRVMASLDPTSLGQTASWTNLSDTVTLTSAVTTNVSLCNAAWTASANVTTTTSTDRKEGTNSTSIAPQAAFTTGLAAYEATGTLDLSGYQQVSFWIKQTSGTTNAAGDISLRLCSDAAGVTTVNTIAIPAISSLNRWVPMTVNTGGNLGNSIQSIALYVDTDRGAVTFLIDNIVACKAASSADSLTLNSLIGKNTGSTEAWYPIRSINGTTIKLDTDYASTVSGGAARGYFGTTESVTTYKRQPILFTSACAVQDSGSSGSLITFSGGWDRTNMSTQTGETWVDFQSQPAQGFDFNGKSFISLDKLTAIRAVTGFRFNASSYNNQTSTTCNAIGCQSGVTYENTAGVYAENLYSHNWGYVMCNASGMTVNNGWAIVFGTILGIDSNGQHGLTSAAGAITRATDIRRICNNVGDGINQAAVQAGYFYLGSVKNNGGYGYNNTGGGVGTTIMNASFSGNTSGSVNVLGVVSIGGSWNFINCDFADATEFANINTVTTGVDVFVRSHDHDKVSGAHITYTWGGNFGSTTAVRHTASGLAWYMSPTGSRSASAPLRMPIGRMAVDANGLVTVKAWLRRTNTALTVRLVCRGGQIAGVPDDVVSSMTASANTWEEVTITFTPTAAGVIEIEAQAYGGTTHTGYIDDMTFSQA
jgi:hypothetical protein